MRFSTSMIYDKGVNSIQQQWSGLLHTQQQVATGRRVLTPADDPIASARALELGQSKGVNNQFQANIGYADDAMKLFESKLSSVGDILHYSRERAVQAGNGALSAEDLRYISSDMKSQFDALLALANSKDGSGDYIFSGYRSQTQAYTGNLSGVTYNGDQGERTIQVSASRYMPISMPGSDVFDRTLALNADSVVLGTGPDNTGVVNTGARGMAVASVDASTAEQAVRYQITYRQPDPAVPGSYEIQKLNQAGEPVPWDATDPDFNPADPGTVTRAATLVTDPVTGEQWRTVQVAPGLVIDAPLDPAPVPLVSPQEARTTKDEVVDGDRFEIFVPSTNLLNNVAMFAAALEKPGASGMSGAVAFALETFDAGQEKILEARAQIGSQMTETQNLATLGSDLNLQYEEVISGLMDVDYAEAISRLTQQQTYLQAAQQSFMKVSNMSLFNFL